MHWVKRNLFFVIGSATALILLVASGLYLFRGTRKNNEAIERLNSEYRELDRLNKLDPHPGKGDVDNIRNAKKHEEALHLWLGRASQAFYPILSIPDAEEVTGAQFTAALRQTIDQLQKQAANNGVIIPPDYSFSFEAEKPLVRFAPDSLTPLAGQLGEVNAICQVLFGAKVNALESLRRERVSPDDARGPVSDYLLAEASVTNELAVISPYQVNIRCFSSELAAVLSGFANSRHGLIVKSVNVRPASERVSPGGVERYPGYYPEGGLGPLPVTPAPAYPTAPVAPSTYGPGTRYGGDAFAPEMGGVRGGTVDPEASIRRPVFNRPFETGANPYAPRGFTIPRPAPTPTPQYQYTRRAAPSAAARGGLQTIIDEQPLAVTLNVVVIKMIPREE